MRSVTTVRVMKGPGASKFNPIMTVHGRIYDYIGALMFPPHTIIFLFSYIDDTDFISQTRTRMAAMSVL